MQTGLVSKFVNSQNTLHSAGSVPNVRRAALLMTIEGLFCPLLSEFFGGWINEWRVLCSLPTNSNCLLASRLLGVLLERSQTDTN